MISKTSQRNVRNVLDINQTKFSEKITTDENVTLVDSCNTI